MGFSHEDVFRTWISRRDFQLGWISRSEMECTAVLPLRAALHRTKKDAEGARFCGLYRHQSSGTVKLKPDVVVAKHDCVRNLVFDMFKSEPGCFKFEGENCVIRVDGDASLCTGRLGHVRLGGNEWYKVFSLLGASNLMRPQTPCTCPFSAAHAHLHRGGLLQQQKSVERRHLVPFRRHLKRLFVSAWRKGGALPLSLQQVVDKYTGAKRLHYERCMKDFLENPKQNYHVGCFVKTGEVCEVGEGTKSRARPRFIAPLVNERKLMVPILLENQYAYPLGYGLAGMDAGFFRGEHTGVSIVASERNLGQRADDIKTLFDLTGCCISLDVTNFDGSQASLAEELRDLYRKVFRDKDLDKVLNAQTKKKVRSAGYKADVFTPTRDSGTASTSVGNKLVMLAALATAIGAGLSRVYLYSDGDDTLVFCTPDCVKYLSSWCRRMNRLGLPTKVDNVAHQLEDIVFCRAKICGASLVKDPRSAFVKMTHITRHFKGDQFLDYLATLRDGVRRLWDGVPVLGSIYKIFPSRGRIRSELLAGEFFVKPAERPPPTRDQFFETFGYGAAEQKRIEQALEILGSTVDLALRGNWRAHVHESVFM